MWIQRKCSTIYAMSSHQITNGISRVNVIVMSIIHFCNTVSALILYCSVLYALKEYFHVEDHIAYILVVTYKMPLVMDRLWSVA